MPSAAALSTLADTANRRESSPSHGRSSAALSNVSCVPKLLDTSTTAVRAGSSRAINAVVAPASALLRKCTRKRPSSKSRSASTASRGPRSEPPMPTLTMSVTSLARSAGTSARMRSSAAATCARADSTTAPRPSAARSAVCRAGLPSDGLTMAPSNIARTPSGTLADRAIAARCAQAARSTRWRAKLAYTGPTRSDNSVARRGSSSMRLASGRSTSRAACSLRAAHSASIRIAAPPGCKCGECNNRPRPLQPASNSRLSISRVRPSRAATRASRPGSSLRCGRVRLERRIST